MVKLDLAHGALFATGELVYVQGAGNKPGAADGGLYLRFACSTIGQHAHKQPARLASTLRHYLASRLFTAAKRTPWPKQQQSCYSLTFCYQAYSFAG